MKRTPKPSPTELKRRVGRPPHEPTEQGREQVQSMAGMGASQEQIARRLGISTQTLIEYYSAEIANGPTVANLNVAQKLYDIAMGNGPKAVTACIFWLKSRGGWSEFSPGAGAAAPNPKVMEEAIGKKEQANRDALTADQGTGWAGLVH